MWSAWSPLELAHARVRQALAEDVDNAAVDGRRVRSFS
jgi:hypothetical protein